MFGLSAQAMLSAKPGSQDERGFVLVWMALMLTMLMGFAGMGVDISHWASEADKIQKAADAAALAGAVKLPGDPAGAIASATTFATMNGFTSGPKVTVVVTQDVNIPTRLKVSITEQVANYFGQFLGYSNQAITRSAISDYQGPVSMGSPVNNFANEPIGAGDVRWSTKYTAAVQPNFWGNVFGPQSQKQSGDAKQAGWCSSGSPDGCSVFSNAAGSNSDYSDGGYYYRVRVGSPPSGGKLRIQIYDPAFVNVGDLCNAATLTGVGVLNAWVTDEAARYATGQTAFCNGDQLFTPTGGDGNPPTTTYVVRGPVNNTVNPEAVPVLAPDASSCNPANVLDPNAGFTGNQFVGYNPASVDNALKLGNGAYNDNMARVFRRWITICTIDAPVAGDYLVQVRTNAAVGSPLVANPSLAGGGANRFGIRAAWVNTAGTLVGTTADRKTITIQGNGAMGVYANVPSGSTTTFYLSRVLPGAASKTVEVKLFDIGDCSGCGGGPTLKVLDKSGNQFGSCVQSAGPGAPVTRSPCGFTAGSTFNARWAILDVPIPANYTCVESDPFDCWIQITYTPPAGSLTDTTTWSSNILGDPVRLVQ